MPTLKLIKGEFPSVLMTPRAKRKMDLIIDSVNSEIGWLGTVDRIVDSQYLITDIMLPKQEVNGGTCEITEDGLVEMADEFGPEVVNKIRLWGHSHNHMGTSPSGQDNSQMDTFTKHIDDFFIRLIANKKGEYNFTIYEFDRNLITEEAPAHIVEEDDDALKTEIEALVSKNVKELTYRTPSYNSGYNQYGGHYPGREGYFWPEDEGWEKDPKTGVFVKTTKKGAKETAKNAEKAGGAGCAKPVNPRAPNGWSYGGYDY